ncbi:hypothetical protein KAR10_02715 [bacterium]|nr:hypothetical protein [bacterium]
MKTVIHILFLLFCLSCPVLSLSSETTTKMNDLHGFNIIQAIEKLGFPEKGETFLMKEVVGEFRVELLNTYPVSKKENQNVKIKEVNWQDGKYNITLWFHQVNSKWIVLNSLRWPTGTDF